MAEAKRKILFVEDEERLRNLMEEHLKEAGYEVFTAADGEIGLKILDEKKPDLVILDLILPKKDGFEFLEEM
ncbi:MAG: DNA-binding response regulator, partial [Candidatus Tagabacteria bacterium CG09_land_8_20_14_0_10_41_14]